MKTEVSDARHSEHSKAHPSPAPSPLRLAILLSILVVIVGALIYDWVIAPPQVRAAYDKLQKTALDHNEFGLKTGVKKSGEEKGATSVERKASGMLYKEDIHQILGMEPTKVETSNFYTIEHYCWWGWIPRNGNFITVLYIGDPDKHHYSTHYANEMPEDELIPGRVKHDLPLAQTAEAGKLPSAASPPEMEPGKEPPGDNGGKGKGRPQGKWDKKGGEPKGAERGTKKGDEPAKADGLLKDTTGAEAKAGTGKDSK